jgi:predicted RNase H-like HicB family nuclease
VKYHFRIHRERDCLWAQCIELEGCITQASSMEQLKKNMEEALNLYIQEPEDSTDLAALPDDTIQTTKTVVEVAVDPFLLCPWPLS